MDSYAGEERLPGEATGSNAWQFRAVQLDLARQMETLDTIRQFIDFARQFGFNAVVLYLEGRVRTTSFPWPAPEDSYTPDQMREIVAYGAERQMDVVPNIATFGHVELFLRHDALKPLAELREGCCGRFGSRSLDAFCPSLEETYRFLEDYLTEVAGIFSSPYFHISCDEVWNMGYCSLCAGRIRKGERLGDLYAKHVCRVHRIVAGKLKRRVIMWDDCFEDLPGALDAIPADIIQCVWQYDSLVEQTKTHLGRRRRDHRMADYDRRGISYMIAPWAAVGVRNTESLTTYAQRFHPMGGLLTLWDGHSLEDQYPAIAFAGRRWNDPQAGNGEQICKRAHEELFGLDDPRFLQALWTAAALAPLSKRADPKAFLRGPLTPYAFERANQMRLLGMVLGSFREQVRPQFGRVVLDGILLRMRRELVQYEIQEVIDGLYEGWNGGVNHQVELLEKGRKILGELDAIADRRLADWQIRRPNIVAGNPGNSDQFERGLRNKLAAFFEEVETGRLRDTGLLEIRYSLPDFFGRPMTEWSVQYEGSTDWVLLDSGLPKPSGGDYSDCPFFTVKHPIQGTQKPLKARIEVRGYGGIGLLYVQARIGANRFGPGRLENISGLVKDPGSVQTDDTGACWLGEPSTDEAFHNPSMERDVHALEIIFE